LVFGKRAGDHAAAFAKDRAGGSGASGEVADAAVQAALAPFEGDEARESAYAVQHELQQMMQQLVGIVRRDSEMREALERLAELKTRARRVGVSGNREFNPGWHTALDLRHLMVVSEAITRAALERTESRGGHFREDHPDKDPSFGAFNLVLRRGDDGEMMIDRQPIPPLPAELKAIIEEEKN
jgi:succinate dehydrogenase / fumarate reductase flavoprotein subunit